MADQMAGIYDESAESALLDILPDTTGEPLVVQDLASAAGSARMDAQPAGPQSSWERAGNVTLAAPGGGAMGVPGWEGTQWRLQDSTSPTSQQ